MTIAGPVRLTFHRKTFFELATGKRTIFLDPVFSSERRGRRVPEKLRGCDYVLATSVTPWFDDVLDVLDECDATFVGPPRLRRMVSEELGLEKQRLLDLEPWERASEPGLRITALPITASLGMEGAIREGTALAQDLGGILPRGGRLPLVGSLLPVLENVLSASTRSLEGLAPGRLPRSFDRVGDLLGLDVGRLTGGRPGLGYLLEVEDHASVMHLADGVHEGTSDDDLEDLADVAAPGVLVLHAGESVEPVVRAVRALRPRVVVLYRARDPYSSGRRAQVVPIQHFEDALEEDSPDCQVVHLRPGEGYSLDRKPTPSTPPASQG